MMFAVACGAAAAQNSSDKVIEQALKPSPLETNLQQLTDQVGGRVPGTPAFDRAVTWAETAFRAAGAESVHTEQFKIAQSWAEGATQFEITAPNRFRVRAVSVAWAPALKATQARIVDVGEGTVKDFAAAGDISGAILLVHTDVLKTWDDLFAEYLKAPPIIDQAVKGKALAIAFMATRWHDILYRHTNSSDGHIDKLPMLVVSREDGERVARLVAVGKKIQAEISIPNQTGGPIATSNVVAELRGSEKPDEFVILGAHLDSWELGTGAARQRLQCSAGDRCVAGDQSDRATAEALDSFCALLGRRRGIAGFVGVCAGTSGRPGQDGRGGDLRRGYGSASPDFLSAHGQTKRLR